MKVRQSIRDHSFWFDYRIPDVKHILIYIMHVVYAGLLQQETIQKLPGLLTCTLDSSKFVKHHFLISKIYLHARACISFIRLCSDYEMIILEKNNAHLCDIYLNIE